MRQAGSISKDAAEYIIGVRGKKIIKYGLLRARMACGAEPYTGLGNLDRKLLSYLPSKGFFVEAGANDGVDQSNTFYLESVLGWDGILIEPFLPLANLAEKFRRGKVIHAAVGSPEDAGTTIRMGFNDLMTAAGNNRSSLRWGGLLGSNPKDVTAVVRTLTDILDDNGVPKVDFLSLDVEGYELEALRGLDTSRHAPTCILVETNTPGQVQEQLGERYSLLCQLSSHDFLFKYCDS